MYKLTAEKLLKARSSFLFLPTEPPIFVCLSACLLVFYLFCCCCCCCCCSLYFFSLLQFCFLSLFLIRLFTVPYFFSKIIEIERFALRAAILNKCQNYIGCGGRPLSSFDTHPSQLPVTQSARSQRSYGKIGDCEQSIF